MQLEHLSNHEITIRRLDERDIDLVRQLLQLFSDAFDEPETYANSQPSDDYLRRHLDDASFIILIALFESQVIGGLGVYELKKFEQERSELFIYDLAVHKDFRRKGIATALIEEVKSLALRRSAHSVFIQSELDDVAASKVYEQFAEPLRANHFEFSPSSSRHE